MNESTKKYVDLWRRSYIFRTFASSQLSLLFGLAFIISNGIIGVIYHSIWHGTICVYYILLTLIRGVIIFFQRKPAYRDKEEGFLIRKRVSIYTHIGLFLLNMALVVPIYVMVKGERAYVFGLTPAIIMAAYTFYRLTFSIIHLRKAQKEFNCLVRELRVINLVDTLVAVLSMQNAIIMAKEHAVTKGLNTLSAFTSALIFAVIVIFTVRSMIVNRK